MEKKRVLVSFDNVTKTFKNGNIVVMKDFSFDFFEGG